MVQCDDHALHCFALFGIAFCLALALLCLTSLCFAVTCYGDLAPPGNPGPEDAAEEPGPETKNVMENSRMPPGMPPRNQGFEGPGCHKPPNPLHKIS